jgi:hypothetical protein
LSYLSADKAKNLIGIGIIKVYESKGFYIIISKLSTMAAFFYGFAATILVVGCFVNKKARLGCIGLLDGFQQNCR